MTKGKNTDLSRRERQIMDIIYQKGEASAVEIRDNLPDKITDSGVRTLLRVLFNKGHLKYREEDKRYIYFPSVPREKASMNALKHLKRTLFNNSAENIVTALVQSDDISGKDLERLSEIIENARKKGK